MSDVHVRYVVGPDGSLPLTQVYSGSGRPEPPGCAVQEPSSLPAGSSAVVRNVGSALAGACDCACSTFGLSSPGNANAVIASAAAASTAAPTIAPRRLPAIFRPDTSSSSPTSTKFRVPETQNSPGG